MCVDSIRCCSRASALRDRRSGNFQRVVSFAASRKHRSGALRMPFRRQAA